MNMGENIKEDVTAAGHNEIEVAKHQLNTKNFPIICTKFAF